MFSDGTYIRTQPPACQGEKGHEKATGFDDARSPILIPGLGY